MSEWKWNGRWSQLLFLVVTLAFVFPAHGGGKLPLWRLKIYTTSPIEGDAAIFSSNSASLSIRQQYGAKDSEFFILYALSLAGPMGGVVFWGNDYLDHWMIDNGSLQGEIHLQAFDNIQHFFSGGTNPPIEPDFHTFLIFPSLAKIESESLEVKKRDIKVQGDRLMLDYIAPDPQELLHEENEMFKDAVLEGDRFRREIDLGVANVGGEYIIFRFSADIDFSLATSGYRSGNGIFTSLPDLREVGDKKKLPEAIERDPELDVAVLVYYAPNPGGQEPMYATHIWLMQRESISIEHEAENTKTTAGTNRKKKKKKEAGDAESQPTGKKEAVKSKNESTDSDHEDTMRLRFIPEQGKAKESQSEKKKSRKSSSRKQIRECDTDTIKLMIDQMMTLTDKVANSMNPLRVDIEHLMGWLKKILDIREEVQDNAAFHYARNQGDQRKKRCQKINLWNMDLILLSAFYSIIKFYTTDKVAGQVTSRQEYAGSAKYVPLKDLADAYSSLLSSIKKTASITDEMVANIHGSMWLLLFQVLMEDGERPVLFEPYHEIWQEIRSIIIFAIRHGQDQLFDDYEVSLIEKIMKLAIDEQDVEVIFFLASYINQQIMANKTKAMIDAEVVYLAAWRGLESLLVEQDISVESLRNLSSMAASAGMATKSWNLVIDRYEKAKQLALVARSKQRLDETKRWADKLIAEVEREQATLDHLRKLRNQRKTTRKRPVKLQQSQKKAGSKSDNTESPDSSDPAFTPKKEKWEQLYDDANKAASEGQETEALALFQEALNTRPGIIEEARIHSAMADVFFVPGEKKVKEVLSIYGRTKTFLSEMALAARRNEYPSFEKKDLNDLGQRLVTEIQELTEPVRLAGIYQKAAVDRLELLESKDITDNAEVDEALRLLQILRLEGEQSRIMMSNYQLATEALIETYRQRKELIEKLEQDETALKPSAEAKVRRDLERGRKKIVEQRRNEVKLSEKGGKESEAFLEMNKALQPFNTAVNQAKKLEKKWVQTGIKGGADKFGNISPGDWQRVRDRLQEGSITLSRNKQRKMITAERLSRCLDKIKDNAENIGSSKKRYPELQALLSPSGFVLHNVAADHFCMFNAIVAWLNYHPDIASNVSNPETGQALFLWFAPHGISLGQQFPNNAAMNALSAAFMTDCPSPQLWGTNDMLHALVSPALGIPILVLTPAQTDEGVMSGTLYDETGTVQTVDPEDVPAIITQQTMVLVHDHAHWQVFLPASSATPSIVDEERSTTKTNQTEEHEIILDIQGWLPANNRQIEMRGVFTGK